MMDGGVEVEIHVFLTSAQDGREWSVSRPGNFTPQGITSVAYWIGGWLGPRTDLDAVEKIKAFCPCWKSNPAPSAVQHVT
jgi:hypothetical protein